MNNLNKLQHFDPTLGTPDGEAPPRAELQQKLYDLERELKSMRADHAALKQKLDNIMGGMGLRGRLEGSW